jgi:hypothetical protein
MMGGGELFTFFEAGMLLCFGVSWPLAVWKTWTSKSVGGKSIHFLWLVFVGYVLGTVAKFLRGADWVLALYVLNGVLVFTDTMLYYRFRGREPGGVPAGEAK